MRIRPGGLIDWDGERTPVWLKSKRDGAVAGRFDDHQTPRDRQSVGEATTRERVPLTPRLAGDGCLFTYRDLKRMEKNEQRGTRHLLPRLGTLGHCGHQSTTALPQDQKKSPG